MIAVIMPDLRRSVVERFFIVSDVTTFTRSEDFMMREIVPAVVMKMAGCDFEKMKIIGIAYASPLDSGIGGAFAPLWLRRLLS